jgi:hypothetical protein
MAQVVKCLPSKHEALSSNSKTLKKKKLSVGDKGKRHLGNSCVSGMTIRIGILFTR